MLQVTNDDKDDSKAVIEQEKEKKSDKPEEATKAEKLILRLDLNARKQGLIGSESPAHKNCLERVYCNPGVFL